MLLAGFVCVGFAGLDEYHQSFVEARRTFRKGCRDRQLRSNDRNFAGTGILLVHPPYPWWKKIPKKTPENKKTKINKSRDILAEKI